LRRNRGGGGLVRDTDTGDLLELLLVMSVATILINRAFLAATRYPRIAFGALHVSHMLWGGLLMLIALVMVFRYWNPSVRRLAAFLSGVGFGLFIDELGKFITKDNDYFYRPTLALIYVILFAMFLSFRILLHRRPLSERETAFNDGLRRDLGDRDDAGYEAVRLYGAVRERILGGLYAVLTAHGVIPAVMVGYVGASLLQLAALFGLDGPAWLPTEEVSGLSLAGAACSSALVAVGLLRIRSSLGAAAHWFRRAVLVSISVTQIFLFDRDQLSAVWGLGANLLIYSCLNVFIARHPGSTERGRASIHAGRTERGPARDRDASFRA